MSEKSSHQRAVRGSRRQKSSGGARRAIRALELVAGTAFCGLLAAAPWLFGSTEDWAIFWLSWGSLAAGAIMLGGALWNRWRGGSKRAAVETPRAAPEKWFWGLNLAVLAFTAIAFWNARATYQSAAQGFQYRDSVIGWLPTSYDAGRTGQALLIYAGCFAMFWSVRHWLRRGWENAAARSESGEAPGTANHRFTALLWVLSINGMLLAIQGILQRLSGSPKLLWLRTSWWSDPLSSFGPFSYRGNAAEYLNLLWPLALGFWWFLGRERRRLDGHRRFFSDGPELLLIPGGVLMLAAAMTTLSRGGALVAIGMLAGLGVLFFRQDKVSRGARIGFLVFLLAAGTAVGTLGWDKLAARFRSAGLSNLSGRGETYENSRQMAADFPWFGTGPGTFRTVYHLYRADTSETWHGYLHDDWMETRVTFGRVGLVLVVGHLVVLAWWLLLLARGKPVIDPAFSAAGAIALAGCLVHAKFDFPFQTYSILCTFVAIAALLTSVAPVRNRAVEPDLTSTNG